MTGEDDIMPALGWYPLRVADRREPTSEDFVRLEEQSGGSLPEDFRDFLARYGQGAFKHGGWFRIREDSPWGPWGLVDRLLGFSKDPQWDLPQGPFEAAADQIPAGTVPFASDAGGNLLLLAVASPRPHGSVWFWDHEGRAGDARIRDGVSDHTYEVAGSLNEFLLALRADKPF